MAVFIWVQAPVIAQNNSLVLFENIKPVSLVDHVSVFFTFNKEKKVQKLQDISKRYALSGVSVMASGETVQGQKFLDQSTKTIRQAINTVSQIQDQQISDRLIAGLAYNIVEQSELIQPLQKQETQILRTTAENLLEHNTRLLQTLSDTSFEQGIKKIQEGNVLEAERHISLAESHLARALSIASTLEHENQKQLVGSILDMTHGRIENLSLLSKNSSDTRIQSSLDKSLRSTTSSLGTFANEVLKNELGKESEIHIDSAFVILDSVILLSKLGKPTTKQEILKTAVEKQKSRLGEKKVAGIKDSEIVRNKKDSFEDEILEKEIKLSIKTQSVSLENAIQHNLLSEDYVTQVKDSRSRLLDYGKKMSIEKEAEILIRATDAVEKTSRIFSDKKDDTVSVTLKDALISSEIEFIENVQDQKIKNIRERISLGANAEMLQDTMISLEKDNNLLVDNILLIKNEEKKSEKVKEVKNKSENHKKELLDISEKNKELLGDVFVIASEKENVFQDSLNGRIVEQKKEEDAKKEESSVIKTIVGEIDNINVVNSDLNTIVPVAEILPVEKPVVVSAPVKPVVSPEKEEIKANMPPCKVSYTSLPVENKNIAIGTTVPFTELEIKTDGCNANIKSFDIVVSGSVAPLVSRKMSQTCIQPTSSSFTHEPRIMYWWGKINLHRDTQTGQWKTDPDGTSGANIDTLTYCKKWYPKTTSVKDYKLEIADSWKNAGNNGSNHIALTLDNISIQDDKGRLSVGPISTAQNRGLYSVVLPKSYQITKNGMRMKVSADIIGGDGLDIILWLSNIIATQENSANILPVETQ